MSTQQQPVVTSKALLFHTITNASLNFTDDSQHQAGISITVHDIKEAPTGSVIGVGRLMSESDKQEMRDFLNGEDGIKSQWLPENLMMINSTRMVWYVPAQKRRMYFSGDKGKGVSFEVWYPSLVFNFNGKKLRVAAYAGQGRPKQTQPLYHAPIWNVYRETHLCNGNADTTNIISVDAMKVWEDAIFNTVFSHSNHANVIAAIKGNKKDDRAYMRFIKSKVKSGEKMTTKEMTPLCKTLEEWVSV